jgi:isoleucyl-tRNA synthetase
MDYKQTLLLPQTTFPMRGNLPKNEPQKYKRWFENQYAYNKMILKRKDAKSSFNLHDGPPYANGHIHIGHALNKILKDIIVKTHYFFGEQVRYVPGWDCHGLPIEQQVEKQLGKEKKEALAKTKIRELCRNHAQKFVDIQKEEFQSLGVIGDWENPYLTMKYPFEAEIYRALCEVAKKGLLVERSKPVYWSWAAKSALAEAEVEYEQKEDHSIYVAFKGSDDMAKALGLSIELKPLIWTTTPWTLPANVAISLNPDEIYAVTSEGFIVAKALVESLSELGITKGEILTTFESKILENHEAINPLNGRKSRIILGEHVMVDGGTGLVHTAPGHGEDDYRVGLRYGLDVIMPVDEEGCYDNTITKLGLLPQEFEGMHVFKANEKILELLGDALVYNTKFTHSYPFCWRTHKPIIYRATTQWFIAMDEDKIDAKTLRQRASQEIEQVKFYPKSGQKRLASMIENRPDWCISRQRDWGVPIAFFRDKASGEIILDEIILEHIANIFEKEGADAWWDKSIQELLPKDSNLDPNSLEKVMDILDVWFDSGSTWKAVLESNAYDAGSYPASMYLEGSDQHRGWFQSSLLVSTAARAKAPYESILTHGFTVDENGEKMSKSKGNVVAPEDIAKQNGVEILRLWVGMSDYSSELKISKNIIKQVSEQYRKIRNTIRFLLANISDLEKLCALDEMSTIDRWILSQADKTFKEVEAAFRVYDFSKGYSLLSHFITVQLSGIYLDVTKDRLYCNAKDDPIRRSAQSTIARIAKALLPLIAPVLTYTVDEAMEHAPKILKTNSDDVFDLVYEPLKSLTCKLENAQLVREKFFECVDGLKKSGAIKTTMELVVQTNSKLMNEELKGVDREDWLTVSGIVNQAQDEKLGSFKVDDEEYILWRAKDYKCPRCWKHKAQSKDGLCPRCEAVMGNV